MPKSLLSSFLNGIADVLEVFSIERREEGLPDCRAILISFIAIAAAVSFSKTIYPPLIALSMIPFLARALNVRIKRTLKVITVVAIFVIAITLPMALYQAYLSYGLRAGFASSFTLMIMENGLPLLLRSIAAAAIVTLMVQSLGLTGLIRGFRGLKFPSRALFVLMIYIRYIPIMLRHTTKLLSAREARLVSKMNRLRNSWLILSTVVGSLLMRGFDKAYKLQMAFRARGLDFDVIPEPKGKIGFSDVMFIALSLVLSCILVLM
ncbi:MAG: energy-coupling factor transporter transmembrane component T family protein [Candidatus Nezhaarchaeales archaeon]